MQFDCLFIILLSWQLFFLLFLPVNYCMFYPVSIIINFHYIVSLHMLCCHSPFMISCLPKSCPSVCLSCCLSVCSQYVCSPPKFIRFEKTKNYHKTHLNLLKLPNVVVKPNYVDNNCRSCELQQPLVPPL